LRNSTVLSLRTVTWFLVFASSFFKVSLVSLAPTSIQGQEVKHKYARSAQNQLEATLATYPLLLFHAFLHGTLTETIYCSQPTRFVDSSCLDLVCRLNKSLYGLKQAPRAWYSRFATFLLTLGFVEAKSDTSLFIYHHADGVAYLLLHVDDIVLTASSPSGLSPHFSRSLP
jgi:hypothetical protein